MDHLIDDLEELREENRRLRQTIMEQDYALEASVGAFVKLFQERKEDVYEVPTWSF